MSRRVSGWALVAVLAATGLGCDDGSTFPTADVECGGFQGLACAPGQICELPVGECQTADLAGVCVERPEACTMEFDPVCGCDRVTYSNDCLRLMAGVQKARDGDC